MLIRPARLNPFGGGKSEYVLFDGDGRSRALTIHRRYSLPFTADGEHNAGFHIVMDEPGTNNTIGIVLSERQMQELFMAYAVIKQEYDTGIEVEHD